MDATYSVRPVRERRAFRPDQPTAVAILVAHGMGQQIPFQTLDEVAEGLRAIDRERRPASPAPVARSIFVDGERLSRLELNLQIDASGATRDVHIYEAYWAPFTEGAITLRDVTRFLLTSGLGGLASGWRPFRRWLFNEFVEFPAPIRTVLYLAAALAVIVSLAWLNALIVAVVLARSSFALPPPWLTDALFGDITAALNVLIAVYLVFGIAIALSMQRRWQSLRRAAGPPTAVLFVAAIGTTTVVAASAIVIVVFHMAQPAAGSIFATVGADAGTTAVSRFVEGAIFLALGGVGGGVLLSWLVTFLARLVSSIRRDRELGWLTAVVFGAVAAMVASIAVVVTWLTGSTLRESSVARLGLHGISWPLVALSAVVVRRYLIQYVGDVVAYVQSQMVDRFFEVRQRIKDVVFRSARTVYGMEGYHQIILAGHSLGSVAMYDALNRLLAEEAHVAGAPAVASRTRLLLTFGSPLDKTAFLFGAQWRGSEAREALAASVQPLISDQACRPKWINIHSRWDIISGSLEYYDLPARTNRRPVENILDPDATALLAAHVEYWRNPTLFRTIMAHLT